MPHLVFLISPANCSGKRASYLLREDGRSALAERLRNNDGATLGEVYTFMSGLYFRGKLAYARAFALPPPDCAGVLIITPGLGLRDPGTFLDVTQLRAIARVPVDPDDGRYARPLRHDAADLAARLPPGSIAVLLGSLATSKYLFPLCEVLGERLRYPEEFVGLGDMSRGALLLRRAAEGRQLTYGSAPLPGMAGRPRRRPASASTS